MYRVESAGFCVPITVKMDNEAMAVSMLSETACRRVDYFFHQNDIQITSMQQPSYLPTDTQVCNLSRKLQHTSD